MVSGHTVLRGLAPKARTAIALHVPQYTVWGAGTDIGKSLVSAGICRAQTLKEGSSLLYLKPVQTGFPADSDSRLVARVAGLQHTLAPHAATIDQPPAQAPQDTSSNLGGSVRNAVPSGERVAHTSFAWSMPASPHLAVQDEGRPVSAAEVVEATRQQLEQFTSTVRVGDEALALVETAGGVASPGPCGALQCDILRPLRLPGLLVGDYRLGGISSTVTAMESLLMRGYDTDLLVMLEGGLGNPAAVKSAFGLLPHKPVAVVVLPPPPGRELGGAEAVLDWCAHPQTAAGFEEILHILHTRHSERVAKLHAAAQETSSCIWWPFTQHSMVATKDITVIDSRCGEQFTVLKPEVPEQEPQPPEHAPGSLATSFDACASWWTQGVSAEQQVSLTRAIAYASGRYGHVMFPENTHAAALACADSLLQGVGKGWASRVFYSDNGSTAIEVAVKMAFRKYIVDHGLAAKVDAPEPFPELRIIGLEGCYHGDTLGAMDCQGPSSFTGNWQFPWYSGRGLWLEPATLAQRAGQWMITLPPHFAKENNNLSQDHQILNMPSRDAAFDIARDQSEFADLYRRDVRTKLDTAIDLAAKDNIRFGALLIEPVVQGAGGMVMIDPLYQRVIMQECKSRSIPIILDEVFCGLWRLGCETTIELLQETPDISCYAKLLTGGTLPLSATLATKDVFDAFHGDSKLDALLHGHSYTAHAIGCQVAVASMALYKDPALNPNWREAPGNSGGSGRLVEMWDSELCSAISRLPCVDRVFALGTLFVCEVKPEQGAAGGYNSTRTKNVVKEMRAQGAYVRPLGNVLYIMATPTTSPNECTHLLQMLTTELVALQESDLLSENDARRG